MRASVSEQCWARHLRAQFDDVAQTWGETQMAAERDVQRLIDYMKAWDPAEPLLAHCYAGCSRRPAAAVIAMAIHNPERHGLPTEFARSVALPESGLRRSAVSLKGAVGRYNGVPPYRETQTQVERAPRNYRKAGGAGN